MSKVRVYELAKDYGMKGPELADLLRKLGFDQIKTHMAVLDEPDQMMVHARLAAHGLKNRPEGGAGESAARGAAHGGLVKKTLPPPVPQKEQKDKDQQRKRLTPGAAAEAEATAEMGAAPAASAHEAPAEVEVERAPPPRTLPEKTPHHPPAHPQVPAGRETGAPSARETAPRDAAEHAAPPPVREPRRAEPATPPRAAEPQRPAARQAEPQTPPREAAPARPERPARPPAETPHRREPVREPVGERAPPAARTEPPPAGPAPRAPEPEAPPAEPTQAEPGKVIKRLLVPQARAQVVGRIELPQETIRDATRRSAPASDRGAVGADRNLRRMALQKTQTRTAARSAPGSMRRGAQSGPPQRGSSGRGRSGGRSSSAATIDTSKVVEIEAPFSIKGLSEAFGIKVNELIRRLTFDLGVQGKTINSFLTPDELELVAIELGRNVRVVERKEAETQLLEQLSEKTADESEFTRAPVVTFMGHVDHGKTSLIDALRKSDIATGEAGGITQHIGAYKITRPSGQQVVILDTPGHAAFTSMRARGASLTDIVVLVVAADDGVMPQTEEAIAHANAANVPIVVAINKIDRPNANSMQVRQQLSVKGLHPEEWGGKTQMAEVSATTGQGLDDLIERIMLEAELLDLKAKPNAPGVGTVIECKQTPEQGVVVNVLVTNGTLRVKDRVLCGNSFSRVRGLIDDHGEMIDEAGPSTPVQILGISTLPHPGDKLHVATDAKKAQEVVEERTRRSRELSLADRSTQTVTLENLSAALASKNIQEIKIILKTDVSGSLEPIKTILEVLSHDEVKLNIIHSGLGGITETDVGLAEASKAIVIGFNVIPDQPARQAAERAGVDIRFYDVIYTLQDDMQAAIEGLLAPERTEKVLGHAEVRAVFKSSKAGNIAGCYVLDGSVVRNAKARLIRDKKVIYTGSIASLKRMKDDAREVKTGFECGMTLQDFDDCKIGDVIECFDIELVKRLLKAST